MDPYKTIKKLGSSASIINESDEIYQKTHRLNSDDEKEAIIKGIDIIKSYCPSSIETPISLTSKNIKEKDSFPIVTYSQARLKPWIKPEWITGLQLYNLGITILDQQYRLIRNGLTFVDARPQNYWLGVYKGKLVDLASIKPLNKQNILSFETDFQMNFTNPLRIEKELNIPISLYFKGDIQSCFINNWGFKSSITSFSSIKENIKNSAINFFSNVISSSSPDFIDYLNNLAKSTKKINDINLRKLQASHNQQVLKLNRVKPKYFQSSNWDKYTEFHDNDYNYKKITHIKNYVNRHKNSSVIVDLGCNLTSKDIYGIKVKIDNDMAICREMREKSEDSTIVMQLDIAKSLSNPKEDSYGAINCLGLAKTAILTGLVHHLIIDYGLNVETFYKSLSDLFDNILIEFPTINDPMVQLLIRKKNENIHWDWDSQHKPICQKLFSIINKKDLSDNRTIIELEKKTI